MKNMQPSSKPQLLIPDDSIRSIIYTRMMFQSKELTSINYSEEIRFWLYRTLLGEMIYAYVTCRPKIGYALLLHFQSLQYIPGCSMKPPLSVLPFEGGPPQQSSGAVVLLLEYSSIVWGRLLYYNNKSSQSNESNLLGYTMRRNEAIFLRDRNVIITNGISISISIGIGSTLITYSRKTISTKQQRASSSAEQEVVTTQQR